MPTPPDKTSSPTIKASDIEQEASQVLRHMIAHGIPLTRKRYIGLSYGGNEPMEWTAEHEMMLPTFFQRDPLPKTAAGDED
jgi:hypothetical protein